jgi:hypothetical protein
MSAGGRGKQAGPNNSMASAVNRQSLSVKKSSLFRVVTTGTQILPPVGRAATFSVGVSHQAAPNNSSRSKSADRLPRPDDCGLYAPRLRNCCLPHADHSKRRGRAGASGLSSDAVRHEGGLVGDRLRPA